MCAAVINGPFAKCVSLSGFTRLFYTDHVETRSNKNDRWRVFLRAERNGILLQRPPTPPLWNPHRMYHPPMFGVLQSSYDHVERELNVMRAEYCNDSVLFVGGDGLALMRMNHLLASKADVYFDQTPFVIPVQGVFDAP